MEERIVNAALAGLLHDVGKFPGRASPNAGGRHTEAGASFVRTYSPTPNRLVEEAVRYHSLPEAGDRQAPDLARLIRLADRLAAGDFNGTGGQSSPTDHLEPILAGVELIEDAVDAPWYYQPAVLALDRDHIFPHEGSGSGLKDDYYALGQEMEAELTRWKNAEGWSHQTADAYLTTLLAILQRYLSFVPASSSRPDDEDDTVWPDVSLYNHLKVTAAIAACLVDTISPSEADKLDPAQQPLATLVRGDFSGIQGFIYRITQPATDAEYDHVSKRLRGRSFYLSLLGEVVADWLVRQLGLPATNILFVGGGQFDLLIPLGHKDKLASRLKQIKDWLLASFYGELDLQFAATDLAANDFGDMRRAYQALTRGLEQEKSTKWRDHLFEDGFLISDTELYHRCPICHLTPMDDPRVRPVCREHDAIGKRLPETTHLAFVYKDSSLAWPGNCVTVGFEAFDLTVGLLRADEVEPLLASAKATIRLFTLNPTTAPFVRPARSNLAQSFSFMANEAPVATAFLEKGSMQSAIYPEQILHFDAIAQLSTGAKRLGILKADVDRLGLLFREGLASDNDATLRPTFGRVMALSSALDLFFAGWLKNVCDQVFDDWRTEQQALGNEAHPWTGKIDGLFYVMYAGGDDLFIIGPWDTTLKLAQQLQMEFTEYACRNANVTLSAGVVQVKARYPVQRFAGLVDEAESQAKEGGRNKVTAFGETVAWRSEQNGGLAELLDLGDQLKDKMATNELPRTLLHDLGRLYRGHQQPGEKDLKPMWTPRLFYTMARRLSEATREELREPLMRAMTQHTILIPVSYASLVTRKE